LSDTFLGADTINTKIVCIILIILMSLTTFTTQRQLMMKNMPPAALESPFAKQQKLLLYILPLVFAVSGVNFPIGVLIYWLTTNVWSMGQQFYVIRRMPAPGSAADRALQERRKSKGKAPKDDVVEEVKPAVPQGQRQQPKRQTKSRRKGAAGAPTARPSSAAGPQDDLGGESPSDAPQAS
jgi:YidC/Oxa1 family membrane protein insertase